MPIDGREAKCVKVTIYLLFNAEGSRLNSVSTSKLYSILPPNAVTLTCQRAHKFIINLKSMVGSGQMYPK